ncbi:MAG: hypothetical protein QXV17_07465 [Candidatus Micrarchaeaceae archaeon]
MQCNIQYIGNTVSIELTNPEEIKPLIKNLLYYADKSRMHPEAFFKFVMNHFFQFDYHIVEPDFSTVEFSYTNSVNSNNINEQVSFKVTVTNPTSKIINFITASVDTIIDKMKAEYLQYDGDDKYGIPVYILQKYIAIVDHEIQEYDNLEYVIHRDDPEYLVIGIKSKDGNTDRKEIKSVINACHYNLSQIFKTHEINILITED